MLTVIVLLLTLVLLFCACKKEDEPPVDNETPVLTLVESGKIKFTIVYSYQATKYETSAATTLQKELEKIFDAEVTVTDDFNEEDKFNQVPIATDDIEILIGNVNRVECAPVFEEFEQAFETEYDWAVRVSGNKVIVGAKEGETYVRAVNYLISLIDTEQNDWSVPCDLSHRFLFRENPLLLSLQSNYKIVYASGLRSVANDVSEAISMLAGAGYSLDFVDDSQTESEYEILVGEVSRDVMQDLPELTYYDYDILFRGNKIILRAGNSLTLEYAIEQFISMVTYNEPQDLQYRFDYSLFSSYITDPSAFVPSWSDVITVPEWQTDFEEKLYAITDPNGRLMAMAHRSDRANYPENSLEGVLSAIMLGADVVELDMALTKDNVIVMMHDDTMTRTTDVSVKKGKNGLPNSDKISDWTFAELRQLNLKMKDGTVTDYKIPSYYEVASVARGRCFLSLDPKKTGLTGNDIMELAAYVDALETLMYIVIQSNGPELTNSWSHVVSYSQAHPENERLAAYAEKVSAYMALPGHSMRKSGPCHSNVDTYENYKYAFETDRVTLQNVNNVSLLTKYIRENFTPNYPEQK